jgi:uncharacterized protein (DUF433 family)
MSWQAHIESRPDVLGGKAVIKNTRISVELILELYAQGWSTEQVLASYPHLTLDALQASFEFAAACVRDDAQKIIRSEAA